MIENIHELLAHEISLAGGRIHFARFMELALYDPRFGYYQSSKTKIGTRGDFITAPELSPIFAHCVAQQCLQVFSSLNTPKILLEFGAGSGRLAVDLLLELEGCACLPDYYYIVELSADLRLRQKQLIQSECPQFINRVIWLEQLPEKPINGVIIANEVLDAMPVHRFKISAGEIYEIYLSLENNDLNWQLAAPHSTELHDAVSQLQQKQLACSEAYESEINLFAAPWLKSVSSCLAQGLVLLIDYGFPQREYYHADRYMGTLMCHYQQQVNTDPLTHIGEQDITAHVDFTAIAEAADACGLTVAGFTQQAQFLLNCGLLQFAQACHDQTPDNARARLATNQAIKLLTLPSEMGELFKVMALTKQYDEPLVGFTQNDQLYRL